MKNKSFIKKLIVTLITISIFMPITSAHADKLEVPLRTLPSLGYATESIAKWTTVEFKMGPSVDYWKKVAQCETGGNWQDKGNFGGGLGIAWTTWKGYGGYEFAKHPSQAAMIEQIIVANRISTFGYQTKDEYITIEDKLNNKPFFRPAVGFMGWGCIKNTVGKPKNSTTYTVRLPKAKRYYCPQFEPMFESYALPAKVFSYIAWRESRCNPGAVNAIWKNGEIVWTLNKNGSYDSGLLQINSSWFKTLREQMGYTPDDLFKPQVNAMFASWILHFSQSRLGNWNIKAYN
jgi:hypothetical protein